MGKATLLIIDDELDNVEALERLFRKDFEVLKATSGPEGLELLKNNTDVALIICDQRMPQMTGVEFFENALNVSPDTVRILLTGYTDIHALVEAINSGQVYRYVTKPWDSVDLRNTVDKGVERYRLGRELMQKNRELSQALAELQVLDKAKLQFMMLINHELKTPITTITSFLELLRESQLEREQTRFVGRALSGAGRLRELVDDVLLLLSAEMGTLKVTPGTVPLSQLSPQLPPPVFGEMQAKRQKLVSDISDGEISTDPVILNQIMVRILHNAIKFSAPEANIFIRVSRSETGVLISVKNPGFLDPETIQQIVRPFFIPENMLNHTRGLGLGLTICQALLRTLGSSLRLSSGDGVVTVAFELKSA